MRSIGFAMLAAGLTFPALAEGPFGLPAGYNWGEALDPATLTAETERRGSVVRVPLDIATAPLSDTHLFTAVYCDGQGLQQLRTATTRYHRGDVLRRFRRVLAAVESELGPPSHGRPDVGTAYWGEATALEAWPVSKAKFMLLLTRSGPDIDKCELDEPT